jgi:hypothetical protein
MSTKNQPKLRFPNVIESLSKTYASPFEALIQKIKNSDEFKEKSYESLHWYQKKVRANFGLTDTSSFPDPVHTLKALNPNWMKRTVAEQHEGWFYSFSYDPKTKDKLPYYDIFLGLNMHYLHPTDRAYFMDKLYNYEVKDSIKGMFKIKITYDILQSSRKLAYYKPCIKRYLYDHVGSVFFPILSHEWDLA